MKKPDEIKKALECCFYDSAQCGECPYYPVSCDRELVRDAREYIRQLEAERAAAIHDMHEAQSIVCLICKNHYQPDPAVKKYGCKEFGEYYPEDGAIVCGKFEWRGVQKEG